MPERCKSCQGYEKRLKDLRVRRANLWRRGELTDEVAGKLAADEQRVIEELEKHQVAQHGRSPVAQAPPHKPPSWAALSFLQIPPKAGNTQTSARNH